MLVLLRFHGVSDCRLVDCFSYQASISDVRSTGVYDRIRIEKQLQPYFSYDEKLTEMMYDRIIIGMKWTE